jgi:pimeloyl-ACP methyl ester carboxylesterase
MLPAPGGTIELADGRTLAFDDVGDPDGVPVLYLHGCPDCRLTRHPDDAIAATAGVRLLALDRPGYGASDPPASPDIPAVAADISALIDALGIERCGVFAWSSGAMVALALAATRPDAVNALALAAGTMPNPGPTDDASIAEIVSLLVPDPLTPSLAQEAVHENKSAAYLHDLATVPGLDARLADAMVAAVGRGTTGVAFDVRAACTRFPIDLASIEPPVSLWYGEKDDVVPLSTGEHLAAQLPKATLHTVQDASHLVALTHWTTIIDSLRRELACP